VNREELAAAVAERAGVTKKAAGEAVEAVFETISDALKTGERVGLTGFGAFDVRDRAERVGCNPQTGEKIRIPATRMPVFKASKILKEAVG
jgi:DNA-binding protein HU-beta